MNRSYFTASLLLAFLASTPSADGEITGATRVASGLSGPIFVTHAPGDTERLFIAQRGGSILILDLASGQVLPDPLVTIPGVLTSGEGGLLGLAFHPDFRNNGKFYVNVTRSSGGETFLGANAGLATEILEFQVSSQNPNTTTGEFRQILRFIQPQNNHNGGWIGFGPYDGYLYIASGDGGSSNDQSSAGGHAPGIGNAQNLYLEDDGSGTPARNLLGKMLRIEVNGSDTDPSDDFPDEPGRNYSIPAGNPFAGGVVFDDEIWSYGLRNPFRASFDRQTGDLWIGDVGQGAREEINFQPSDSPGGENYGWRTYEGTIVTGFDPDVDDIENPIPPIYEYLRPAGNQDNTFRGTTVTGGVVYRGPDPQLRGTYIFGDFNSNHIWSFDPADPMGTRRVLDSDLTPDAGTIGSIVAFGEDADGNLYIVDIGGEVFRIDTTIGLVGDYDGSGIVDAADYEVWKSQFGSQGLLAADGNGDQIVDAADYTIWRNNLGRTLPFSDANLAAANVPEPQSMAAVIGLAAVTLLLQRKKSEKLA